jgi:predicted glycoside hydrolase/deacetylase ChbG (UPF0249 family)
MQEESLAERLGHLPSDRLLIVNCDDFGSSHAANIAIERAMNSGFASSATLMVPCPWAREAASRAAGLDVGVHLTLTAEYPGYRWRSLTNAASLHDKDGFLPRTAEEVWENANLTHIELECRAQIEQALAWGVDVTHLDAHMGTMQIDRRYFGIYLKLARHFRLPLRMVSGRHEKQLGFDCREPAENTGILFPDNFIAPRWGRPAREILLEAIGNLRPGVSEIFLHPVEDGPELRGYDLENPDLRASDYDCLMDPDVRRAAEARDIMTISFRPLRELMRNANNARNRHSPSTDARSKTVDSAGR